MATSIQASPEGILARRKSGTPLVSAEKHEQQMLEFREQAREEALAAQSVHREAGKVHEYISMIEGKHWPGNRRPWRSNLYANRMAKARLDTLSMLTDIKPTLDIIPEYIIGNIEQQATIGRRIIQSEWIRRGMMIDLIEVTDHAMLSTGFWKIGGVIPGKLMISACGFDNVLPIQPTMRLQEASGILYRAHRPLSYFFQKWPEKSIGLEEEAVMWPSSLSQEPYRKPDRVDEITWKNASTQMKYHLGMSAPERRPGSTYFPMIPLEEYWIEDYNTNPFSGEVVVKDPELELDQHNWHYKVAPRRRLFPGKRLIVFAGDRLMYDGPNPYWHGMYPFSQLNLNPVVWGHGSLSRYRDLVPINKAINEIIAGVHDLIRRAVNPQMAARERSVRMSSWLNFWGDKPGEKLLTKGSPDEVKWISPPQLPSYVIMMLMQYLVPEFDKMSGVLDIAGMAKKAQVPGGDTIEQMRDSLQTQLRLESRFIEQFLIDSGQLALSNIFQFFTMEQRLKYLGPDGVTYQDYDFDPGNMVPFTSPKQSHWKTFSLQVAEGSLHGSSRDREKQMAIALYKGRIISRKELLRKLGWGNIDQIEEELAQEMQAQAEAGASAGDVKGMPRMTRGARNGEAV